MLFQAARCINSSPLDPKTLLKSPNTPADTQNEQEITQIGGNLPRKRGIAVSDVKISFLYSVNPVGAPLMSISTTFRITRRLVTLASLGLAGLIAGLLAGCSSSPRETANTPSPATTTWEFTTATTPSTPRSIPYDSIDARQTPSLHHPPSARRLQYGSVPTSKASPIANNPRRS